ncbi:MAG TPA: TRAP transporter large permease subunit [Verrucomicrobiota bacterium]|nr:TRAP transporter large permease subunit [Verrucomicrobiota bacterium]HQL78681.1 TRAP transporter large permease subunit [Verrucomicrobiota bacterium]
MSAESASGAELHNAASLAERTGFRRVACQAENLLLVVALAAMLLLPVVEIILRHAFNTGISGSSAIVQHLTLIVGMLGGAVAARERRLLALSPVQALLKGRARAAAQVFSSGFAAAICLFLCVASLQYVLAMKPLGRILVYGIPVWVVQLILPIGFGLVALRLIWHATGTWLGRGLALALAAALAGVAVWAPISPARLEVPGLVALAVATLLGAPVFTALGGAALLLFWGNDLPIQAVPLKHYSLTTNDLLPSIPIFTLAGYFLAESGASKRLVRVFQAMVGQFRGGPAIVTALVCAFFTSFTGASGVTVLALGGVLMPVLIAARYSERNALGLLTGAGSLGMLFPPCLPLILYAIVANTSAHANLSIKDIFLGGIGPGILLVIITAWWGIRKGSKEAADRPTFRWAEARAALWDAKWELIIPVVAIGSLFTVPTIVEAAAVTATSALLIATVIHRDLRPFKDLPRVITQCGLLVGGVLLILGVALGFTHYMVDAQLPDKLVGWATSAVKSKWLFLLGLNIVLLFVGGLVEIYAAIIVVVPLLVPLGVAFGIDPIHLGIIFLANMELGFLCPPVGLNLLLSSYRFNKPMAEVIRATFPMLLVLLIGVLLITYFPPLTTFLPGLFK